jgi:hypothetical protein
MQDDFDSGMGIPDDELAGESAMSEGDALGHHDGDVELDAPEGEPVGRASGGARAMASGGGKPSAPRKAAPAKKAPAKKAAAKKTAKPAKKAKPARKSAGAKKAAGKSARKTQKKKAAKRNRKNGHTVDWTTRAADKDPLRHSRCGQSATHPEIPPDAVAPAPASTAAKTRRCGARFRTRSPLNI